MYRNTKVAVVIPCYNEEKLITKTVEGLPEFVDFIIAVNDASTDDTLSVLKKLKKKHKNLAIIDNIENGGVGYSLITGFRYAIAKTDAEAIGIVAGDAQFDTSYLQPMLDEFIDGNYDYVKASRFFHRDAFKKMPKYRQFGNIFISLLTKFSTGYYTITDITNGCGFLRNTILEKVDFSFVKLRYDYETSMLTALSIAGAKIKDHAVPAIYGEEKSTINLLPTAFRNLYAIHQGFWRRIYYKYILYGLHPVALFLFSGLLLFILGIIGSIYILYERIVNDLSPSTGTVMLVVLPLLVGFQLLLSAVTMDMNNENKD